MKLCDVTQNVIDQFISPYPAAYRNTSSIVLGQILHFRTPLEVLPEKFIIEVQLRDFSPLNSSDNLVAQGVLSINKSRFNADDVQSLNLSDPNHNTLKLTLNMSIQHLEPEPLSANIHDFILSAKASLSYVENIGPINKPPMIGDSFDGLPVMRCLGFDDSDAKWTWFVVSADDNYNKGHLLEGINGFPSISVIISMPLRNGQKFVCLAPSRFTSRDVSGNQIEILSAAGGL